MEIFASILSAKMALKNDMNDNEKFYSFIFRFLLTFLPKFRAKTKRIHLPSLFPNLCIESLQVWTFQTSQAPK